jgi:predicted PurR-regulated permease PerM
MEEKRPIYINITTVTIIKIMLVFVLFYLLFVIRNILAVLFVSLILSSAIDPWVDWLQARKIPRGISALLIYLFVFSIIGSVVYLIIPPIMEQVRELLSQYPEISNYFSSGYEVLKEWSVRDGLLGDVIASRNGTGEFIATIESFLSKISGFIGGLLTFFLVMVMTFYMTVEEGAMKKIVWSLAPAEHQVRIMGLVNKMQKMIGLWLRGQMILSLIIAVLIYVGLSILGIKYALVLAMIAGLTEFVPYLGPILAAVPAIFLAFAQSGFMLALITMILYYIIQVVENNIIVPKLMQKVVGLNPIISLAVLLIGLKIAGVAGAVLAIPTATAISVIVKDLFNAKAEREVADLENIEKNK